MQQRVRRIGRPVAARLWNIELSGYERLPGVGPGDPVPEPHQLPRLRVPDVDRAAQHLLRRQGRVHGLVEDQVPVPGDGHDPDRSFGWRQEHSGARRGRSGAAARRAVRHLPRGDAEPQRQSPQGSHRCGPPGDEARLPDLPGRRDRHRPDPAAGREGSQAVQQLPDQDRPPDPPRALPRSRRRAHRMALDDRRGDVRDPRTHRSELRQHVCRSTAETEPTVAARVASVSEPNPIPVVNPNSAIERELTLVAGN